MPSSITHSRKCDRPPLRFVIFTGDKEDAEVILKNVKERFNLDVSSKSLECIRLRTRPLLEASMYPYCTLLLQMLAGFIVGMEALLKCNPEVFIDTMGYPMTLPVFRWIAGARVGCYVHYPTISSDMIEGVRSRKPAFNNPEWIARSNFSTTLKVLYYRLCTIIYRVCGISSEAVMVNGSWTKNHIVNLWKIPARTFLVYPPCDVDFFMKRNSNAESLLQEEKFVQILSVSQIRPEKNHELQLRVFSKVKEWALDSRQDLKFHFVICGGCRNEEDNARVKELKIHAEALGLTADDLEWALNVPVERLSGLAETFVFVFLYFNLLSALLPLFPQRSLIGIHTMNNEHFGISVVEGLAAGLIMVAHNSGGPKMDIITESKDPKLGFLSSSAEEYLDSIQRILKLTSEERNSMRKAAKSHIMRFTEKEFDSSWNNSILTLIP
ncbi:unnamed protein product [Enterobius vermicularis]|uniref:GDP-Man:Man(3)GlcNAc(2)-PP-Dol alpha-1,2-mannosyltransferase n=1 Tax=Enterobius vermicularis TaxID=51028 RepID=A0A158QAU2_ENTVE|nr:unnamed protein product [Enterobius vermicularis]